jgi:ArsR family transcriptional regulator, arsenate/arsenite/antimonite-responsive transcriptional repressor
VDCCSPSQSVIAKQDAPCLTTRADTTRIDPGLEEAALLFRALGDETRLAILRQLRDQGEVCACDFLACCTKAQPTVSHHLKVLRDAGLVDTEKRGLWVHYRLNADKAARVRAYLP